MYRLRMALAGKGESEGAFSFRLGSSHKQQKQRQHLQQHADDKMIIGLIVSVAHHARPSPPESPWICLRAVPAARLLPNAALSPEKTLAPMGTHMLGWMFMALY